MHIKKHKRYTRHQKYATSNTGRYMSPPSYDGLALSARDQCLMIGGNNSTNHSANNSVDVSNTDQPNLQDPQENELLEIYKEDYDEIIFEKSREFMMKHFEKDLKTAFEELSEQAGKMIKCSHTVTFTCEDHFDLEKVQVIVVDYFQALGYKVTPIKVSEGHMDICLLLE